MLNSKPLAAAIGGAVGGFAAAIVVVLAVLYHRKRNRWRRQNLVAIDPGPVDPSSILTSPVQSDILNDWSPTTLLSRGGNIHTETNDISPSPKPRKPDIPFEMRHIPTSLVVSTPKSQNSSLGQSHQATEAEVNPHAVSAHSSQIPTGMSNPGIRPRLTEEQSELVQGLIRHNVPLPTVVGAIEGLLGEEVPHSDGGGRSDSRFTQSDGRREAGGPPDYDYV
jgi:hypothetical protein